MLNVSNGAYELRSDEMSKGFVVAMAIYGGLGFLVLAYLASML
jgi:hypothetical protein